MAKREDTLDLIIMDASSNDSVQIIFKQVRIIPYKEPDRGLKTVSIILVPTPRHFPDQ